MLLLSIGTLIFFSCETSEEKSNTAPTCSITSPTSGSEIEQGDTIKISVEAEDEDGNIKEVLFYVDDSIVDSVRNIPYSYDLRTSSISGDRLTIKARAFNEKQASAKDSILLRIIPIPIANFEADKTTFFKGESIQFTDLSKNDPTSWFWDFGDGNTSTSQNPTHTYSSAGTYTVKLTVSNAYGSDTTIKTDYIRESGQTPCDWNNSRTFTDTRDGKTYKQTQIGDQCWMAENLNYDQNSYGKDWCYKVRANNCNTYGRLYNWAAVLQGESPSGDNPSGVQGVCPDGWHVPSDREWKEMEMQLGMSQSEAEKFTNSRGTNEGSKIAGNAILWKSGSLTSDSEFGSSGFTALPSSKSDYGSDNSFSYFYNTIGEKAYWWTSIYNSQATARARYLKYNSSNLLRTSFDKRYGLSIRCVKDK